MSNLFESPALQKICSMSGITAKALRDQLITNKDLIAGLEQNIREVSNAKSSEDVLKWLRAGLVLTQAACDLFVSVRRRHLEAA